MRSSRLALAVLGCGLAAVVATAQPQAKPATVHVLSTAGAAAALTDSRGGGAIVTAANMGAGDSVSGDVRISFDGDASADVKLEKAAVTDTPGPGGGQISDALLVAVNDLTTGRQIYAGPLATMPALPAGKLAPGGAHDYRFTVTLPRSAGNGYQGSLTRLAYVWTATDAAPDPVAPEPPQPPPPPTPPDVQPPKVTLGTKKTQRIGRLAMTVHCDEACRLSATARVLDVKVSNPTVTVSAGGDTLRFKFTKRALTKLIHRGRAILVVTVTAVDAAGNRTIHKQRVTITFSRAPRHVIHPIRIGAVQVGVRMPTSGAALPHRQPTSLRPPRRWPVRSTGRR